jgi:hypothetical protein
MSLMTALGIQETCLLRGDYYHNMSGVFPKKFGEHFFAIIKAYLKAMMICRRSDMIADRAAGSKYLPTELPQKPNWPTEPIICRRSQLFADGPKYLPTELPRSQICRRS